MTRTPLTDIRRIETRPDPFWDGAVRRGGAADPDRDLLRMDCLDEGVHRRALSATALLGATWDALQPNRKTIYDSGGRRSPSLTGSVSIPFLRW